MAYYPLKIRNANGNLVEVRQILLYDVTGGTRSTIKWTIDLHRETGCRIRCLVGVLNGSGEITSGDESWFTVGEFKRVDTFECGEQTSSTLRYIQIEANVPDVEIIGHTMKTPYRKPDVLNIHATQSRRRRLMNVSDCIEVRPQFAPEIYVTGALVTNSNMEEVTAASEEVSALLDSRQVIFIAHEKGVKEFIYTLDGTEPTATNGTRIAANQEYDGDDDTGIANFTGCYAVAAVTLRETATVKVVAVRVHLSPVARKTVIVRACLNLAIRHNTGTNWRDTFRLDSTLANAPELEYLWYSDAEGLVWKTLAVNTDIEVAKETITQQLPYETMRFFMAYGVFVRAKAGSDNVFWTSANARAHWNNTITRAKGSVMSLIDPTWWTDTVRELTQPWQFAGLWENCTLMAGAAPRLEARVPTVGCYYRMFASCEALTSAVVKLESLANDCATEMFRGCYLLQSIESYWSTWPTGATTDWVVNVAARGEYFDKTKLLPFQHSNVSAGDLTWGTSTIPPGWSMYSGLNTMAIFGGNCAQAAEDGIEVD